MQALKMVSAFALGTATLASAAGTSLAPRTFFQPPTSSGCSNTGPASCTNTSVVADTCCFEANGQLLQVQFWDTDPPTGPADVWTIHGLWPDYCVSGYPQNCDPSRAYTNISDILQSLGQQSTLDFMNTYWKNQGAPDETFWAHEWDKHGTCYTTLQTSCLPANAPDYAEVGGFFDAVINLYQNLTTYDWLAGAGIYPDATKTWTYDQLTSALKTYYGFTPSFDCDSGQVYQVSYYYSLIGSVIDGIYLPQDAPAVGSCPSTGIQYLPKNYNVTTTTSTSATQTSTTSSSSTTTSVISTGTAAPSPLPTGAHFDAVTPSGAIVGGVLSLGTWSTQTLATMHINGTVNGFTITTSKGPCQVSAGVFSCASSVTTPSTFTAVAQPNGALYLAYQGNTTFSSDGTPSGSTVFAIYSGVGHAYTYQLSIDQYPAASSTSSSSTQTSTTTSSTSSSSTTTSSPVTTTTTTSTSTSTSASTSIATFTTSSTGTSTSPSITATSTSASTSTSSTTTSTSTVVTSSPISTTSSSTSPTSTGPTLASGWTTAYACATDVPSRVFASPEFYQVSNNSPEYCTTFCGSRGFGLAGVEYSDECYCAQDYAQSTPPNAAPVADCHMACSGDANSTCGGGYRVQIYLSVTALADVAALPAGWALSVPCAVDTADRVFTNAVSAQLDDNTPQRCVNHCVALGYTMAGVEYGNECYCGNAYRNMRVPPVAPASQCDFSCAGAPSLTCGGSWGIQLYTSV